MLVRVRRTIERVIYAVLSIGVSIVMVRDAYAAGGGGALPWDTTLTTLQNDATGTVAHAVVTGLVVTTGIGWAFAEHGSGLRTGSALAFGGAGALGAAQEVNGLFGAGALI